MPGSLDVIARVHVVQSFRFCRPSENKDRHGNNHHIGKKQLPFGSSFCSICGWSYPDSLTVSYHLLSSKTIEFVSMASSMEEHNR